MTKIHSRVKGLVRKQTAVRCVKADPRAPVRLK
jgi:hypothetical protein